MTTFLNTENQSKKVSLSNVILQLTSSSVAAERPREPLSQLKSCQLLHNCTKNVAKSPATINPIIPSNNTSKLP